MTTKDKPEDWGAKILRRCTEIRTRRRRRLTLAIGVLTLSIAAAVFAAWEPMYRLLYCHALYAHTEAARFLDFTADAQDVVVIGQNLRYISQNAKERILDEIADERKGRVRILLMHPGTAQAPNSSIDAYDLWSPNSGLFASELRTSVHQFKRWVLEAQARELDVEVRLAPMIPFSANFVEGMSGHREMQIRPYLYKASGNSRPVLQFNRRCHADVYDKVLETFEGVWGISTPILEADLPPVDD